MTLLMRAAQSRIGRSITSWVFAHMSFALPVRRLRETETLIAFHHPKPAYAVHILLVPKKALGSVMDLTPADAGFLTELFETIKSLVVELGLEQTGYRLVVNGGEYQNVAQLHFHLISGDPT
jgi:histidine triad (HIT) family protein